MDHLYAYLHIVYTVALLAAGSILTYKYESKIQSRVDAELAKAKAVISDLKK